MTERLTKRNSDRSIAVRVFNREIKFRTFLKGDDEFPALDKLAHYEDLEEQGRLVILPEGFDKKGFKEIVSLHLCPRIFALKDRGCVGGESSHPRDCKECWETALKGGAE